MSDDAKQFRARAASANAIADGASLDNVRDRERRSANAWTQLANRAEHVDAQRVRREAETAARTAAARLDDQTPED